MAFTEYSSNESVMAEPIGDEPRNVITPNGPVVGQPGQWEVRHSDGNVTVMDDEDFQSQWGDDSEDSEQDSGNTPTIPTTTVGESSGDSDPDSDPDSSDDSSTYN